MREKGITGVSKKEAEDDTCSKKSFYGRKMGESRDITVGSTSIMRGARQQTATGSLSPQIGGRRL